MGKENHSDKYGEGTYAFHQPIDTGWYLLGFDSELSTISSLKMG